MAVLSAEASRIAASNTCPQAYGNRRVMEDVTPSVRAEAIMRVRSGLAIS